MKTRLAREQKIRTDRRVDELLNPRERASDIEVLDDSEEEDRLASKQASKRARGGETVSLSLIPLWSVSGLCFVVVSSLSQSKWQRKAGGVKGIKFSDEAPDNNVRSVADPSPLQEK